jgi:hypothetical protein
MMRAGEVWHYHDGGNSQWTKGVWSIDLWHQVVYADEHCSLVKLISTKSAGSAAVVERASFNQMSLVVPSEFEKGRALASMESIK